MVGSLALLLFTAVHLYIGVALEKSIKKRSMPAIVLATFIYFDFFFVIIFVSAVVLFVRHETTFLDYLTLFRSIKQGIFSLVLSGVEICMIFFFPRGLPCLCLTVLSV